MRVRVHLSAKAAPPLGETDPESMHPPGVDLVAVRARVMHGMQRLVDKAAFIERTGPQHDALMLLNATGVEDAEGLADETLLDREHQPPRTVDWRRSNFSPALTFASWSVSASGSS